MSAAGNDGTTSEVGTSLSDERVDVHVLVVPVVAWRSDLRFAYSSVCLESASAGFVRVGILTTLVSLREEIASQLSASLLPGQYVFLRNLGRCFSWISCKQEESMTVSMFIPPMTGSPEIYVLDAACFHGFPEGIVETYCGVVNDSRHSIPIDHNILLADMVTHPRSQPLMHTASLPPHHPDHNLVAMQSHDAMSSHDTMRSRDATRSRDASQLNFVPSNRKIVQQQLPNVLPQQQQQQQLHYQQTAPVQRQQQQLHYQQTTPVQQQQLRYQQTAPVYQQQQQLHYQQAAPVQLAYTSDGSDLVQHRNYHGDLKDITNANIIHTDNAPPSKAGSNNESINSNSLSDHSYAINELHQESEVLATSYAAVWQSPTTRSLVVADSAANSLCSTTLSSSLNGAHHAHSPTKSLMSSPNASHESYSSSSKMLGPRVNVDLSLADSVITENTEVLERALFGSRGDGEGSSLTNSLLNITGATSGHHLQQHSQFQLQDYNHGLSPSSCSNQPHPQLVLHYTGSDAYGNQQSSGHHSNITDTRSPSNHTTNENASLNHIVTSTPHGNNITVVAGHHTSVASGNISAVSNPVIPQGDHNNITGSHSPVTEQFQPQHSNTRSNNIPHNTALQEDGDQTGNTRGHQLSIQSSTANNPLANQPGTLAADGTVTNKNPSNALLTDNSEQLSPDPGVVATAQGSTVNSEAADNSSLDSPGGTMPSHSGVSSRRQMLQQGWNNSVSSDVMALRGSLEGDGHSQSRMDTTVTISNNTVTSHEPTEHHVSITDGEHQLEHTVSASTVKPATSDGQIAQQSDVVVSSVQNSLLNTKETYSTPEGDKQQSSPLSNRESGVGTSTLFNTSPLPPITVSPEKNSTTSEGNGKPAELDEVNQLLAQLRIARDDRRTLENTKRGLSDTVKKLQRARKGAQDREEKKWKKMYFQEKKLTQTNEDRLRRLRNEVYRRMGTMATTNQQDTTLKGVLSPIAICEGPSEALNVKIQCARVEQELARLRQRLVTAQERLKVEQEARVLAEAENRAIRRNVLQQKINCSLTRTI